MVGLDAVTGQKLWDGVDLTPLGAASATKTVKLVAAAGRVVFPYRAGGGGGFAGFDPRTGKLAWNTASEGALPISTGGKNTTSDLIAGQDGTIWTFIYPPAGQAGNFTLVGIDAATGTQTAKIDTGIIAATLTGAAPPPQKPPPP